MVKEFGLNGCPMIFDLVGKERGEDHRRPTPKSKFAKPTRSDGEDTDFAGGLTED